MSATNMKLFLLLGFSLLLYHEIEGITIHSVTGCSDSVRLNCSNTEMIHVERITHYNITACYQAVTDLQVCRQPVTRIDTELVPYCNGKITCNETLSQNYCPGSKTAKVDYRCIPGNDVKDMCDTFIIENTNRIFLSTPNFPFSPSFTDISACRCSIRGTNITSIQILELILTSASDGTKSSLEIKYGDVTFKADSFRVVINERLSTSTTAEIILNHNNINEHYLWIEVQGVDMRVSCNNDTNANNVTTSSLLLSSTSTTSTTTTTHQPQTSDIKCHSQDKDTIIILAVLLSLCLLIICIAAIIILIRWRRGVRVNQLHESENETNDGDEHGESTENMSLTTESTCRGRGVCLNRPPGSERVTNVGDEPGESKENMSLTKDSSC